MLRNIIYIALSVLVFFAGMIIYGIILNIREDTLAEAMNKKGLQNLQNVHLVIDRKNYKLILYSGTVNVKSYKAVFGRNNATIKKSAFDYVTPNGVFEICDKDSNVKYHKNLKLNYPRIKDAAEALKNGVIKRKDYLKIKRAIDLGECPPSDTPLGANIGIHGIGKYNFIFKNLPFVFNWTDGSIAVSNENIDELFKVTKIGIEVKIQNY